MCMFKQPTLLDTNIGFKQPIILDSDIGTDVDDAWALATCLGRPKLHLVGFTTVSGKTDVRGSIALKFLQLAHRQDVPVAIGERRPLCGPEPLWQGHEGKGILKFDGSDPTDYHPNAVDFILEKSEEYKGELVIVAIGPPTNIAQALKKDPSMKDRVKEVLMMGGGYTRFNHRIEHNFRSDPCAARILLTSKLPVRMIGYEITARCRFSRRALMQMLQEPKEAVSTLQSLTEIYLQVRQRDYTRLHDALVVATLVKPDLMEFQATNLFLSPNGKTTPASVARTPPRGSIAVTPQVAAGETFSMRQFRPFLQDRLQKFFESLPDRTSA